MVEYLERNFKPLFLQPRRTSSKSVRKQITKDIRQGIEMPAGARAVVARIVCDHRRCRGSCSGGHPILQVAMRLCFLYGLQDSELVSQLLKEVYSCEKTFEKLFAGAIFGISASRLICGWRSDFSNAEENIEAVAYFLRHSNKSRCLFGKRRFAEITMTSCGLPPLVSALQVRNKEMFALLMRYGADFAAREHLRSLDTLKQLCKNKVLFVLWENWELPSGIPKLPLPRVVIEYLEKVEVAGES